MDLRKPGTSETFFEQVFEDMLDFAGAADHANVPGVGFKGRAEGVLVQVVAAGDDDDPGCLVGFQFADGLWNVTKFQLHFIAKNDGVGQVAAVIYDDDTEIKSRCQA